MTRPPSNVRRNLSLSSRILLVLSSDMRTSVSLFDPSTIAGVDDEREIVRSLRVVFDVDEFLQCDVAGNALPATSHCHS